MSNITENIAKEGKVSHFPINYCTPYASTLQRQHRPPRDDQIIISEWGCDSEQTRLITHHFPTKYQLISWGDSELYNT